MNALMNKILVVFLLFFVWSCQGTSDHIKYWADHKEEYKQLTDYSEFLNELNIESLNQYGIVTKAKEDIKYADIKSEYPQDSKQIFSIIGKLKKLNAEMLIGEGYCSFFIKSGGVLASDEWLLFTEKDAAFEDFKKDIFKIGYEIIFQNKLEENWYFIVTD